MTGPGKKDLNNFNLMYSKLVESLQDGDILFLGGDFVNMCLNCCINDSSSTVTNPQVPSEICGAGDKSKGGCVCEKKINQNKSFPNQATVPLTCCYPKDFKKYRKGSYSGDEDDLIEKSILAMKRGAKIIMLDDLMFMSSIYPDSKAANDYMNTRLQVSPNFYHYVIPGWPLSRSEFSPHTHSKICAGIYLNEGKPGLRGIWGSFNPSYSMSITNELGILITGLLSNKFISILTQYLVNISYFFIRTPPSIIVNGVATTPTLGTLGQIVDSNPIYDLSQLSSVGDVVYNGNWGTVAGVSGFGPNRNPETPQRDSIDFVTLTNPLVSILQLLAKEDPDLPVIPNSNPKIMDLFSPILNNKDPVIVPVVKYCGKVLPTKMWHRKFHRGSYRRKPTPRQSLL